MILRAGADTIRCYVHPESLAILQQSKPDDQWWPRKLTGLAGAIYPQLRTGSKVFWRDLYSVTGVWVSAFALVLNLTGLPWAAFWGDYFKSIRRLTGTAVASKIGPVVPLQKRRGERMVTMGIISLPKIRQPRRHPRTFRKSIASLSGFYRSVCLIPSSYHRRIAPKVIGL